MKLTFLGTKGEIEEKSRKHKMHSCLLIENKGKKVLIDFGQDWHNKIDKIKPDYILLTHAHPDHAWGLKTGTDIPVYATKQTFDLLNKYKFTNKTEIKPHKWLKIGNIEIFPYEVVHSTLCPSVGFKIKAGRFTFCYNPDLIFIKLKKDVLTGVKLYIGDGSTVNMNLVRKIKGELVGHTNIRTQIHWCKEFGIKTAIFTHFGKQAVEMKEDKLIKMLKNYSQGEVKIKVAHDGFVVSV